MKNEVTVQRALQMVADRPGFDPERTLETPVHELVCRELFRIANHPDGTVRGSMTRANKARRMIFDRLVGKRMTGTAPAQRSNERVELIDLTKRALGDE